MGLSLGSILIGGALSLTGFLIPPYAEAASRYLFNEFPNRLPNISELILAKYLKQIDPAYYKALAQQNGFNEAFADMLFDSQRNLIGEVDSIIGWRRGIISEDRLNDNLERLRYNDTDIEYLKKITEFFPSAGDLVRFAVREVYNPQIVQQYQLKIDLPDQFIKEAAKSGLQKEQAENYWAAHWELPSTLQGFEMLHRRVIDEDTLNTLLKALDVMPFWRDKLTKISFNPLTRVDVRRMYGLGVLSEEEVFNSYLDVGYNEENAQRMTDFTKRYEGDETTGITRSSVLSAYKKDIISKEDLIHYLQSLEYSENTINFWMELVEYEKHIELIENVIEDITNRYIMGDITVDQISTLLNQYDLPSTYVNNIITKIKLQGYKKIKVPSKSDVETWLKLQLINEKQYCVYMSRQGYNEKDIQLYLSEITSVVDTSKKKFMTLTIYSRWFATQIMTEQVFRDTLLEMNYKKKDIDRIVKEIKDAGTE